MHAAAARPTGLPELDRVLDGGLVPGSVTLLAGEPGMGKSTLLLQALGSMAELGARCLLVTAEESSAQVRMRAERLGALARQPARRLRDLAAARRRARRIGAARRVGARLDPDRPRSRPSRCARFGHPGARLRVPARAAGEGTRAGHRARRPRHEGRHPRRAARARARRRHRPLVRRRSRPRAAHAARAQAPVREHVGARAVRDDRPRPRRRARRVLALPPRPARRRARFRSGGRCSKARVRCSWKFRRWSCPTACRRDGRPRASIRARLAMVLAVLDQHGGVSTAKAEVYASVAGGLRVTETGVDLALALAVGSARRKQPVVGGTVAVGEVGLGGEIRAVPQLDRRLDEAARLGFTHASAARAAVGDDRDAGLQVVAGTRRLRSVRRAWPRVAFCRECRRSPRDGSDDVRPAPRRAGHAAARRARPHPAGPHGRAHRDR